MAISGFRTGIQLLSPNRPWDFNHVGLRVRPFAGSSKGVLSLRDGLVSVGSALAGGFDVSTGRAKGFGWNDGTSLSYNPYAAGSVLAQAPRFNFRHQSRRGDAPCFTSKNTQDTGRRQTVLGSQTTAAITLQRGMLSVPVVYQTEYTSTFRHAGFVRHCVPHLFDGVGYASHSPAEDWRNSGFLPLLPPATQKEGRCFAAEQWRRYWQKKDDDPFHLCQDIPRLSSRTHRVAKTWNFGLAAADKSFLSWVNLRYICRDIHALSIKKNDAKDSLVEVERAVSNECRVVISPFDCHWILTLFQTYLRDLLQLWFSSSTEKKVVATFKFAGTNHDNHSFKMLTQTWLGAESPTQINPDDRYARQQLTAELTRLNKQYTVAEKAAVQSLTFTTRKDTKTRVSCPYYLVGGRINRSPFIESIRGEKKIVGVRYASANIPRLNTSNPAKANSTNSAMVDEYATSQDVTFEHNLKARVLSTTEVQTDWSCDQKESIKKMALRTSWWISPREEMFCDPSRQEVRCLLKNVDALFDGKLAAHDDAMQMQGERKLTVSFALTIEHIKELRAWSQQPLDSRSAAFMPQQQAAVAQLWQHLRDAADAAAVGQAISAFVMDAQHGSLYQDLKNGLTITHFTSSPTNAMAMLRHLLVKPPVVKFSILSHQTATELEKASALLQRYHATPIQQHSTDDLRDRLRRIWRSIGELKKRQSACKAEAKATSEHNHELEVQLNDAIEKLRGLLAVKNFAAPEEGVAFLDRLLACGLSSKEYVDTLIYLENFCPEDFPLPRNDARRKRTLAGAHSQLLAERLCQAQAQQA